MNRDDFTRLSLLRLEEARTLFKGDLYNGAYYLAGYAVECALKACFAKQTQQFDFPDKEKTAKVYTHKLLALVMVSGLQSNLEEEKENNNDFKKNWDLATRWDESARYSHKYTKQEASELIEAITNPKNGVMQWLEKYW